jgi:hypothetical protein
MDGALASGLYRTDTATRAPGCQAVSSRGVAVVSTEALGASPSRAATGADLGGSSKYSNENFED